MAKRKVSDVMAGNIRKMKELGYSVSEIAVTVGVSRITVYDYVNPGFYDKRSKRTLDYCRRTRLVTGTDRKAPVILTGLSKREYPGVCELCGKEQGKGLYYHHWDDEHPDIGLWLCYSCHRIAEYADKHLDFQMLIVRYFGLKLAVSKPVS